MIIAPGATLGVLGSGQLGRMFTIAARRMGYRVHTFSPDQDTPTGQVADREVTARYEDLDALRAFAKDVAVVTFHLGNVGGNIGRRFFVLARSGDSWKITHLHASNMTIKPTP